MTPEKFRSLRFPYTRACTCLCVLQQVATPTVVKKILRMKQEQPTMFAWEIREQLARQGACDSQSLPSVSSVNRILRGGGLHADIPTIEGGTSGGYASQIPSNAGTRGEAPLPRLVV